MNRSFGKEFRLLSSQDFEYLRKGAYCFNDSYFRFYYKVSQCGGSSSRIGLSVSKKVGNAVSRNFIKRSLREAFRASDIKHLGFDILIIASPKIKKLSSFEIFSEIKTTFKDFYETSQKKLNHINSHL